LTDFGEVLRKKHAADATPLGVANGPASPSIGAYFSRKINMFIAPFHSGPFSGQRQTYLAKSPHCSP
jgi:hypothetical protein